jgi:acylphosphatase
MEKRRLHIIVHGEVQGVNFRTFTYRQALRLGITGFVRNLSTGEDVEVEAEGDTDQLRKLLELLKTGPPEARVDRVAETWSTYLDTYPEFKIRY